MEKYFLIVMRNKPLSQWRYQPMPKYKELLQQLINCESNKEFYDSIKSMLLSGNYQIIEVLKDYYKFTSINEHKKHIIKSLKDYPDKKSAQKFLFGLLEEKDDEIKVLVIKTIYHFNNPVFIYKLISIYQTDLFKDTASLKLQLTAPKKREFLLS